MGPPSIKVRIKDERCVDEEKDEENCGQPAGNDSIKDERRPAKKKKNKKGEPLSVKDEQHPAAKKEEDDRKSPAGKSRLSFVAKKDEVRRKSSVRCKVERLSV